jgi:hypothetical protein
MMRIKEKSQGNRKLTGKRLQEYNLLVEHPLKKYGERKRTDSILRLSQKNKDGVRRVMMA